MKFEKVSFEQYLKSQKEDREYTLDEIEDIRQEYDDIKLPQRATVGSAGYDFFSPIPFRISTNDEYPQTFKLATGIRVLLDKDKVLECYPRSGHGFKFRLQLDNTVGIIDSDYYYSDNEGHIFAKLTIDSKEDKTLTINKGEAFMQGIIKQFFLSEDDATVDIRNGGFGSTTDLRKFKPQESNFATEYKATWIGGGCVANGETIESVLTNSSGDSTTLTFSKIKIPSRLGSSISR
jgi:dUTP pyrophosphatase